MSAFLLLKAQKLFDAYMAERAKPQYPKHHRILDADVFLGRHKDGDIYFFRMSNIARNKSELRILKLSKLDNRIHFNKMSTEQQTAALKLFKKYEATQDALKTPQYPNSPALLPGDVFLGRFKTYDVYAQDDDQGNARAIRGTARSVISQMPFEVLTAAQNMLEVYVAEQAKPQYPNSDAILPNYVFLGRCDKYDIYAFTLLLDGPRIITENQCLNCGEEPPAILEGAQKLFDDYMATQEQQSEIVTPTPSTPEPVSYDSDAEALEASIAKYERILNIVSEATKGIFWVKEVDRHTFRLGKPFSLGAYYEVRLGGSNCALCNRAKAVKSRGFGSSVCEVCPVKKKLGGCYSGTPWPKLVQLFRDLAGKQQRGEPLTTHDKVTPLNKITEMLECLKGLRETPEEALARYEEIRKNLYEVQTQGYIVTKTGRYNYTVAKTNGSFYHLCLPGRVFTLGLKTGGVVSHNTIYHMHKTVSKEIERLKGLTQPPPKYDEATTKALQQSVDKYQAMFSAIIIDDGNLDFSVKETQIRRYVVRDLNTSAEVVFDVSCDNCPLCVKFTTFGATANECEGCPISKSTGKSGCEDSPWLELSKLLKLLSTREKCGREHGIELKNAVDAELQFLKSLQ
jgi:hypothetical protein